MSAAARELLRRAPRSPLAAPWEGRTLPPEAWARFAAALGEAEELALLGLWAEPGMVYAALRDEGEAAGEARLLLAATPAPGGRYAALSPTRPGAALFERMVRDLWGLVAEGAVDPRPLLDHGRGPGAPFAFLPAHGAGLHQIGLGPIHAGISEPGHCRFQVEGEAIARLEIRLGYTHKGTLGLMRGKPARAAARFAARLSGDSTVAHALAFARAVEAASATPPPPRASALRRALLELERLHNHLHDIGAICEAAAFPWPHALCSALREGVLRAAAAGFGHRLMMDRVVPGGVAEDIAPEGAALILAALDAIAAEWPGLRRVLRSQASLQDRLAGTGVTPPDLVRRFAAGGVVGRAAGRGFDARGAPVAVEQAGDVAARLAVRLAEVEDSLARLRGVLDELPEGELLAPLPPRAGEAAALAEGFRGECLAWVRLDDGGLLEACFLRDPSWLHWPLLERAVPGHSVDDFPLIEQSFNASHAGCDL